MSEKMANQSTMDVAGTTTVVAAQTHVRGTHAGESPRIQKAINFIIMMRLVVVVAA
jgi:hypothetical protein